MNSRKSLNGHIVLSSSLDFIYAVAIEKKLGEFAERRGGSLKLKVRDCPDHRTTGLQGLREWPGRWTDH